MPLGGGSLLDDLADCEEEQEQQLQPASPAAVPALSIDAVDRDRNLGVSHRSELAAPTPATASTPLEAYLRRIALHGTPSNSEGSDPAVIASDAPEAAPDGGSVDSAVPRAGASPENITQHQLHDPIAAEADAPPSLPAPILLCMELVAPALLATIWSGDTLAAHSRSWCVRACIAALRAAHEQERLDMLEQDAHADELDSKASLLQHEQHVCRQRRREARMVLHSQRAQLVAQMQHLRLLHLLSLGFAAITAFCCFVPLLWMVLQRIGLGVVLPLVVGRSIDVAALTAAAASAEGASAWAAGFYLAGTLLAVLNFLSTARSLSSCTAWHATTSSLLQLLHAGPLLAEASKQGLLELMERELVRRGFQLTPSAPTPTTAGGSTTAVRSKGIRARPPIERMDAAAMATLHHAYVSGGAAMTQDQSMRLRTTLQRVMEQQDAATAAAHDAMLLCSAAIDQEDFAPFTPPPFASAVAPLSTNPVSLVQLKVLRARWMHTHATMLRSLGALLRRMDRRPPRWMLSSLSSLCATHSAQSMEQFISAQMHALQVATAQHMDLPRAVHHPASSSSSAFEDEAVSAQLEDDPVSSLQLQEQRQTSLFADLPGNDSRRVLHGALKESRAIARSAERRVQLALERHVLLSESPSRPAEMEAAKVAEVLHGTTKVDAAAVSGWLARVAAALAVPAALSSKPSLRVSSPSASPPYSSPILASWNPTLSHGVQSDAAYLRHLAAQMRLHADTLDAQRKRLDAEHGVHDEEARESQPTGLLPAQQQTVAVHASDAEGSSGAPCDDSAAADADAGMSKAELLAALAGMRNKTPAGMGALFEGEGEFDVDAVFRSSRGKNTGRSGADSPPPSSSTSLFSVLSELKNVLQQRPAPYEYFAHSQPQAQPQTQGSQEQHGAAPLQEDTALPSRGPEPEHSRSARRGERFGDEDDDDDDDDPSASYMQEHDSSYFHREDTAQSGLRQRVEGAIAAELFARFKRAPADETLETP